MASHSFNGFAFPAVKCSPEPADTKAWTRSGGSTRAKALALHESQPRLVLKGRHDARESPLLSIGGERAHLAVTLGTSSICPISIVAASPIAEHGTTRAAS